MPHKWRKLPLPPACPRPTAGSGQHPPAPGEQWEEPAGAVWSLPPPAAVAALQSGPGWRRPSTAPAAAEDVWEAGFTGPSANGPQVLTIYLFYSYLVVATTFLKLTLLKRTIQCVFIISELNINIKLSLLTVFLPPRWLGLFKQTDVLIGGLVELAGRHFAWE